MSWSSCLKAQPSLLWRFLGFFQHPFLRVLHAIVTVLVVGQIISSYGLGFKGGGPYVHGTAMLIFWYHVLAGLLLVGLGVALAGTSLWGRGVRYFYPYLWGDIGQLRQDMAASLHFKLIAPRPKGLAAVVQGLGLGALLLTAFSGLLWFVLWLLQSPYAHEGRELHKSLSVLIVAYLLGHGAMALIHFVSWQRRVQK